tara:strand:+ start:4983 stop:5267 length:285 start_codon:yes stop_codon:yes gene_type:complete
MRIKKKHVIEEINDPSKINQNYEKFNTKLKDIADKLEKEGLTGEDAKTAAVDIVTGESVNESTVSITKGKLLETILNKKPRKVVKTIRVGDLKK